MSSLAATPAMMQPKMQHQSRNIARLLVGAAVATSAMVLCAPYGFMTVRAMPLRAVAVRGNRWVGEQPEIPRGEAVPKTQMRGRYADGDRSRKNNQGGGRLPIPCQRNPVLAYANADEKESGASVLRRMVDMYDLEHCRMVGERQRYFRLPHIDRKFCADWSTRAGARRKANRIKKQYEEDWQDWMRREGRRQGLTKPLIWSGPPLPRTDEELEEAKKKQQASKPSEDEYAEWKKTQPKAWQIVPKECEEGQWYEEDDPENIFKLFARPLRKTPYDIGKRGDARYYVPGTVLR